MNMRYGTQTENMDARSYEDMLRSLLSGETIRQIGAVNSLNGQDTRLIHANPKEEAILKMLGGSGRIDPITGLPHYEENDNNAGYDSDGGGGWRDDSGRHHSGANDGDPGGATTSHRYEKPNKSKQAIGKVVGGVVGTTLAGPAGSALGGYLGSKWGQGGMVSNRNYGGFGSPATREPGDHSGGGDYALGGNTSRGNAPSLSIPSGGGSAYPSVYSDPITGRLMYNAMSPNNMSNQSYSDQLLIDALTGSNVASSNRSQQISSLQKQIASMKAAGQDTSYFESELARLEGLATEADPTNPLLYYTNSGLRERVMNEQTDRDVENALRLSEDTAARRGLGTMGSMQDQLRASLGLSTAQAKNKNKLSAEDEALKARMSILDYLKGSQGQEYQQNMGRTAIPMTFADWENQRQIAEIAASTSNSQFDRNMDFMEDQNDDANRNAWLGALGQIGGSVDWGSIF